MSLTSMPGTLSRLEARHRSLSASFPLPPLNLGTRVVHGRAEILRMQPLLMEMCDRFGQPGAMDHLDYFITSETALKKTPHLVLVGMNLDRVGVRSDDAMNCVVGALLVYEYRVLGIGTGIFATDDTTGRRPLIAPANARAQVTRLAIDALLRSGAHIVMQSLIEHPEEAPSGASTIAKGQPTGEWIFATRDREIPSYLALEKTMDATLARMGQHTRRNLRYYRRRAEAQLGAAFIEQVPVSRAEFVTFNRQSAYAVSDETAGLRYDAAQRTRGMFLSGIRDSSSRWLSMIGGRRYEDIVEVDWQMNRSDMAAYSLSTVMRAFFIEAEIERGTRKMFLEGGTPHVMRYSFAIDRVRDVVVVGRSWLGTAVGLLWRSPTLRTRVRRWLQGTNFVLDVMMDEAIDWQPWGRG